MFETKMRNMFYTYTTRRVHKELADGSGTKLAIVLRVPMCDLLGERWIEFARSGYQDFNSYLIKSCTCQKLCAGGQDYKLRPFFERKAPTLLSVSEKAKGHKNIHWIVLLSRSIFRHPMPPMKNLHGNKQLIIYHVSPGLCQRIGGLNVFR